jgi:hypothetical protein
VTYSPSRTPSGVRPGATLRAPGPSPVPQEDSVSMETADLPTLISAEIVPPAASCRYPKCRRDEEMT